MWSSSVDYTPDLIQFALDTISLPAISGLLAVIGLVLVGGMIFLFMTASIKKG